MATNREDKIKVREALVDTILSLMITKGKFWLDEHRRVIDKNTGILPGIDGRKMSKSYENTIPIFSSEDKLRKVVMKIQTNSLEPGEPKDSSDSNIFSIYKAISTKKNIEELDRLFLEGIAWGEAKNILFE